MIIKAKLVDVNFQGKSITAVKKSNNIYIAMKPIVENIGLDWSCQSKKLEECQEKFSCGLMPMTGKDGKKYNMLCIPLHKLNGWLFSINPKKVREDIRENLIAYQDKCFMVLHDHFNESKKEICVEPIADVRGLMLKIDAINALWRQAHEEIKEFDPNTAKYLDRVMGVLAIYDLNLKAKTPQKTV